MNRLKLILIIALLMLSNNNMEAQVKSLKLRLALQTMLSHKVPEISVVEAHKTKESFLFLDAREVEEFSVSHIYKARFVGAKRFELKALADVSKDMPLIVYCSIGKRSEDVGAQLVKAGFANVKNLYGGIFEWMNEGYTVVGKDEKPTNKIHAFSKFWGMFLDKGEKVY